MGKQQREPQVEQEANCFFEKGAVRNTDNCLKNIYEILDGEYI
jgi:hypothetical protein